MPKKKILFRSGSLRMGGLERVLIEVLQNIDTSLFHIHLLIDDDAGDLDVFKKDIPKTIPFQFLKSREFVEQMNLAKEKKNHSIFHKIRYNFLMWKSRKLCLQNTLKYIKEQGPFDVVVDYDAGANRYIKKIPIRNKIIWIHNSIPQLLKKKSKILHFGKRLEDYTVVVAICDEMKENLKELFPSISNRITRIYNPFCFERIEVLQEDNSSLSDVEKKQLEEDYCIMVSRLDCIQKDYDTLLKAFQLVKEAGIPDKLYIVGDGPDKKNIERKVKEMGLEDSIFLIGFTKNPYIWIEHSKLLIHSSKYEGFGLVLVEAFASSKMVISSNCPTGPKEILDYETCGKLFPVGDFKKLAEHLITFLPSKEKRMPYEECIQTSKFRFEQKNIIKEYEHLLEHISPGVNYEKN